MVIEFVRLNLISCADIVRLHNDQQVLRHLPLAGEKFDIATSRKWIESKEQQWREHGIGPLAIQIDGQFAGWGGFQMELGNADLALVLFPVYWGKGVVICRMFIRKAFEEYNLESITALLPVSRTKTKGMQRLGFKPEGAVDIEGHQFIRYRLLKKDARPHAIDEGDM
ncbi:MAG: GNAT family N-acetyltransferase [Pseudomonadales bacterium]|nr:GNAT family N-acetyltransferase [Pseudomonadales bacterium]